MVYHVKLIDLTAGGKMLGYTAGKVKIRRGGRLLRLFDVRLLKIVDQGPTNREGRRLLIREGDVDIWNPGRVEVKRQPAPDWWNLP